MAIHLLAAAIMGLLLLAVVLVIARGVDWRSNNLIVARSDAEVVQGLANSPAVWVAAFLTLALGLTGVVLVAVGDFGVPAPGISTLSVAALGGIVLLYLVGGTYVAARDRNVSSAGATLAVAVVLGTLLLAAVAGTLLMGP